MDSIFFYRNPQVPENAPGPLKGVRIAVQSNIPVAGWPTQAGSEALAGFNALENAAVVERLEQNGAVIVGSTQMSEFGFGLNGKSAAGKAVERKQADAEVMLDLAGEVRLAACRAGLWGFKPSWGLVPRVGVAGLIPSMEACGIIGDAPGGISAILKTVAGPDERDFSQPALAPPEGSAADLDPKKIKLGVVEEALATLPVPGRKAFEDEIAGLKKAGFSIESLSWQEYPLCLPVHRIVGSVEASSCAGRYDSVRYGKRAPGAKNWNEMYLQSRGAAFGTLLKSYLIQGAFFQFERYDAYENACRIRARLVKDAERLMSQAEMLIFPIRNPSAPDMPETLTGLYEQVAQTALANVLGVPALYLPPTAADRPGLQLVGPKDADMRVLALGETLFRRRAGGK